jgi:hypothetical protein
MNMNGCGAAHTTFCMTPEGNLQACCAFPMPFGNLTQQNVNEILSRSPLLKEWRMATLQQYEECGKHDYCSYCNLCAGNNYVEHGDFRKPSENNCTMAKTRCNMASQMKQGRDFLNGQNFVTALKALPKTKMSLRRIMIQKG